MERADADAQGGEAAAMEAEPLQMKRLKLGREPARVLALAIVPGGHGDLLRLLLGFQ